MASLPRTSGSSTIYDLAFVAAARANDLYEIQRCVDEGQSVNCTDRTRNLATPLQVAAQAGHTNVVSYLLCLGATVDAADANCETALMLACRNGNAPVVTLLLRAKASLTRTNLDGMSAISIACVNGRAAVVDMLCASGANICEVSQSGMTTLQYAVQAYSYDTVVCVINQLKLKFNREGEHTPAEEAAFLRTAVNTACRNTVPPLSLAAMHGHAGIISNLHKMGADLEATCTAMAASEASAVTRCPVIGSSFFLGADETPTGYTALFLAARANKPDTVRQLAALGANVDVTGQGYRTALSVIVEAGWEKTADALLDAGASLEEDARERPRLAFGAACGSVHTLRRLIKLGLDVNATHPISGQTAVMVAAAARLTRNVRELIRAGANVHTTRLDQASFGGCDSDTYVTLLASGLSFPGCGPEPMLDELAFMDRRFWMQ